MLAIWLLSALASMSIEDAHAQGPFVPDSSLTPGDVLPVSKREICIPGYSKRVRYVPASVKQEVFRLYGITSRQPYEFEVDHLISLELGGSNSIRNLFPQSYKGEWNARIKDKLENKLHWLVCCGAIELQTAQQEIASNWIAAYLKYQSPAWRCR